MKPVAFMLIAMFGAAPTISAADSYSNQPMLKPPPEALRDCIDGYVVIDFFLINGHPIDMRIIQSDPEGLYTTAFLDWWTKYDAWRREQGLSLSGKSDAKNRKKLAFKFEQCAPNKALHLPSG